MIPCKRLSRQRGLTLIEVLVALTIMTFSFVAIYRAVGSGVKAVVTASNYEQAAMIIESLRSMRDAVPEGGWVESGSATDFAWRVASTPYGESDAKTGIPTMHRVEYHVYWKDRGVARELSVISVLPSAKPLAGGAQ